MPTTKMIHRTFALVILISAPTIFQPTPCKALPHTNQTQLKVLNNGQTHISPQGVCIPQQTLTTVNSSIQSFPKKFSGRQDVLSAPLAPLLYPFYPQGGTLYRDITTGNFVDLDPTPGVVLNYLCESYGNDGHQGMDSGGLTWEEMTIGQPVFAALAGTVIDARDGDPDMNTSCEPNGNWVILGHGGGRQTWYFHLKKDSVAVVTGQKVEAGEQLGLVGSSGCSFGPHLHFQSMQDGDIFEPFNGPCQSGASGWTKQIDPPPSGAFVRDMGVTIQDIGAAPPLPYRAPVDNQIPTSAYENIFYWIQFGNLPANSQWKERYVRPDGSTEYELGPFPFNNPTDFQVSQYWFDRFIGGMETISGTWRIQFEVNGSLLVDAPVEVVTATSPTFNRPPVAISAKLDPQNPKHGDVVFARVNAPALGTGYRDPDWDILRYRYQWKINGNIVRDVISVGMADALAASYVVAGARLSVTITAGDGFGGTPLGETARPVTLSKKILGPFSGHRKKFPIF